MNVLFDSVTLQPVAAPQAPPPRPQAPISPVGEGDAPKRDPREQNKGGRQRHIDFQSFITASTLEGLGRTLGGDQTIQDAPERRPLREAKYPDAGPKVLSGAEAANYFRTVSGESEGLAISREFQTAASAYAKNFFAVQGTFARPGESLELSA